jgi:protein TonB
MSVLGRERRWASGLSAALHLLALGLFLARPHRLAEPAFPVRPPPLTVSIEPVVAVQAPPPRPRPRPVPDKAAEPAGKPLAPAPLPSPGSPPRPTLDAPPSPLVWNPAPPPALGNGSGSGEMTGAGEGGGGGAGGIGTGGSGTEALSMEGPQWIRRPTEAEMMKLIPIEALRGQVGGTAILACLVRPDNRAHRCKVLSESPPGLGFGLAAQRLSRGFLIKPPLRNGQPRYDVPVRIPVLWEKV